MRQQRLGKEVVKDFTSKTPRNKQELLESAGYSRVTARATPGRVLEQKGTIRAIEVAAEAAGFTEEAAKKVVGAILDNVGEEAKDRLKAAELIFKVQGSFAAEKNITLTVKAEDLQRTIAEDLARFRQGNKP